MSVTDSRAHAHFSLAALIKLDLPNTLSTALCLTFNALPTEGIFVHHLLDRHTFRHVKRSSIRMYDSAFTGIFFFKKLSHLKVLSFVFLLYKHTPCSKLHIKASHLFGITGLKSQKTDAEMKSTPQINRDKQQRRH